MSTLVARQIASVFTVGLMIAISSTVTGSASQTGRSAANTAPNTSCTSPAPCKEYDNLSTGSGLRGTSTMGNGIEGITNANAAAAVSGTETTAGSKSMGVYGKSTNGRGVVGETAYNNSSSLANGQSGVNGRDTSTTGTFNAGVRGFSTNGYGIVGISQMGVGVFGETNKAGATNESGVLGMDNVSAGYQNTGVSGYSIDGNGVYGNSKTSSGVVSYGGGEPELYDRVPSLSVVGDGLDYIDICDLGYLGCDRSVIDGSGMVFTIDGQHGFFVNGPFTDYGDNARATIRISGGNSNLISAGGYSGTVMRLDSGGNIHISGEIFTHGSCHTGCARLETSDHASVTAYMPNQAVPSIEDFGKGQITAGQGYVALDPAFARTIDPKSEYLVFLTAEGDNRGLFVTAKTPQGFVVRESMGGRSTLSFDYRIVAKPFNDSRGRLPAWSPVSMGGPRYVRPQQQPSRARH